MNTLHIEIHKSYFNFCKSHAIALRVFHWSSAGCFNFPPENLWHTEQSGRGARCCTTSPRAPDTRKVTRVIEGVGIWTAEFSVTNDEGPGREEEAAQSRPVCDVVAGATWPHLSGSLWWNHNIAQGVWAHLLCLLDDSIGCQYFTYPLMWILILISLDISMNHNASMLNDPALFLNMPYFCTLLN